MRLVRIVGISLALACVALLVVALATPLPTRLRAPVVSLVSMEPAKIFDDTGKEMWLASLRISNPNTKTPPRPENSLYVKDFKIQIKVTNVWVEIETQPDCQLFGGDKCERLCLFPADADYSRCSLKYTGTTPIFSTSIPKNRLHRAVQQLPLFIRRRLPSGFWKRIGFGPDYYGPSSTWQTASSDMPISVH